MAAHPALKTQPSIQTIELPERSGASFLAERGDFLKRIESALHPYRFELTATRAGLQVSGDDAAVLLASKILERFAVLLREKQSPDTASLRDLIASVVDNALRHELAFRLKGLSHPVRAMSLGQVEFFKSLLTGEPKLVFGVGPTGTGKTHLAIAAGLNLLAEERVKRLVITRPHVVMEGEIVTAAIRQDQEYDDQFAAFEDILHNLVGHEEFDRLVSHRLLEITPLGRMRGRTFNDAYIVIDDAQNMTIRKMRMAVTRLGQGARMVVTGDPSHTDLRGDEPSGLPHLLRLIEGTGIADIHRFDTGQIIRNETVARIEKLYAQQGGAPFPD